MTVQSHPWQSSPLASIPKVANGRHRTANRTYIDGCLVLVATSAIAINAWALFPSSDESEHYGRAPDRSTLSATGLNSAREGGIATPVNAFMLMNAKPLLPTMHGSLTGRYPSPAVYQYQMPLRSKLQALLMLLYSLPGDMDPAAMEAKLQALLQLPDAELAQLMAHPDLAALNEILDAGFLGTSDLSGVKTELDKIDVTPVPGTSEQIQLIKISGKPTYTVRAPAVTKGTETLAAPAMPAPPPAPTEPVTMAAASQFEVSTRLAAPAAMLAPSDEQLNSPPSAPPPPPPSATLSAVPNSQVEPTGSPQTSPDIMTSGNKFEPGETVPNPSADNSGVTQTAVPSTAPTNTESPAENGGADRWGRSNPAERQ